MSYQCEYPGCEVRVPVKIGDKAGCLQHVNELTTLAERRRAVGLHPDVPPPGFVYLEQGEDDGE